MTTRIETVRARRVWDSRGWPTVETEVTLANGATGRAIAPAGASTGSAEALDRRDGGERLGGRDVSGAIDAVNGPIAALLAGRDARDQSGADHSMIETDGTATRSRFGGNALVATSLAIAHAAAASAGQPLWRYLAGDDVELLLPLPEVQIFGGGAHAGRRVDVQDFMVIATGAASYAEALDWTAEVYHAAGALMRESGRGAGVADEGGYWPLFGSNEEALDTLVRAIERAGLVPGDEMAISLDVAATDFRVRDGAVGVATDSRHDDEDDRRVGYRLAADGRTVDSDGLSELLLGWLARYPIVAIEDPLAEDDRAAMARFTAAAGPRVEVIADDFICTNAALIEAADDIGACNTALIKPNQAGTLSEARAALDAARSRGWQSIVSARSGESEDVSVVHLAVGWGVRQLKVGSFARSERMAKWNEGLRIADALEQDGGRLAPRDAFPWGRR